MTACDGSPFGLGETTGFSEGGSRRSFGLDVACTSEKDPWGLRSDFDSEICWSVVERSCSSLPTPSCRSAAVDCELDVLLRAMLRGMLINCLLQNDEYAKVGWEASRKPILQHSIPTNIYRQEEERSTGESEYGNLRGVDDVSAVDGAVSAYKGEGGV